MIRPITFLLVTLVAATSFAQTALTPILGPIDPIRSIYGDSTLNQVWVGSNIVLFDSSIATGIATWDGMNWIKRDSGIFHGNVQSTVRYQGELYFGGSFDVVGQYPSEFLAKWEEDHFIPAEDLPNGSLQSLKVLENELYVMGHFDSIGNHEAQLMAKWDGSNWHSFPRIYNHDLWGYISDVEIFQGKLYMSGNFSSDLFPSFADVAVLEDSAWSAFGGGLTGGLTHVNFIITFQDQLIIGGAFNEASGDPGNSIVAWDGQDWHTLGQGLDLQAWDAVVYNDKLYVGGQFDHAGGLPIAHFAVYDGTNWSSVGDFNHSVNDLTILGNRLYIGGAFSEVNGQPADHIAVLDLTTNILEPIPPKDTALAINFNSYFNQLSATNSKLNATANLSIFNINGQRVHQSQFRDQTTIDLTGFSPGVYLVEATSKYGRISKKIVVTR